MSTLGPYTLHTIETGRFGLDGGAMFGIVPRALWSRRIEPDAQNRIPLAMRCLLLEGSDRLILIDDGLGDKYDEKFGAIYAVDQESANLSASLKSAGFGLDDVTDVVLTHLHFDHCGGSTRRAGDRLEPSFPNARFHVQRSHWEWAIDPNEREAASFLRENLEPLAASGRLNLLHGEVEIAPGVDVLVVNGHTEAQQLVRISDGDRTLVFVADLLPTTAHVRPVWIMAYDVRPLVTLSEKTDFLERAVTERWDLFFEHDPAVEVAGLERTERGVQVVDERTLSAF
jgi:glyoxylase-like metal-dependent hydrolase (beta-lactamase superfamily II)